MPPKTLKFLEEFQKAIEGGAVKPRELVEAVEFQLRMLKEQREEIDGVIEQFSGETAEAISSLEKICSEMKEEYGEMMKEMEAKIVVDNNATRRLIEKEVNSLYEKMPEMPDMEPMHREFQSRIAELEAKIPVLPEEKDVEGMLAELKKWIEEQLQNLKKELQRIDSKPAVVRTGLFGGGRPVHVPMVDIFTGDGSNKTFYLDKAPRDLYTVKAWGSDFPHILTHDSGNGFTISGKTLTIDSQTDAPSSGARFVVEYYT